MFLQCVVTNGLPMHILHYNYWVTSNLSIGILCYVYKFVTIYTWLPYCLKLWPEHSLLFTQATN